MELETALGLLAGTVSTMAFLPQVIKTWRTKSGDGLSWAMLIIVCLGVVLWLTYGVYVHDTPLIFANLMTLALSATVLGLKIRYRYPAKP